MPWVEIFAVFLVSHLVGDYLLQTNWQATHKYGGLGADRVARRALVSHIASYSLAFVPVLVWLADDLGAAVLVVLALVAGPHLIQDDGRLIGDYVRNVKHAEPGPEALTAAVDQTFHVLALFLLALAIGG